MAGASISGKEHALHQIFSDEFVFRIPGYQRPYAWTTEQTSELLTDLLSALGDDDKAELAKLPPYFLGSVVLIKPEKDPFAAVVDGQQRLTTLTILFAVLRAVVTPPKLKVSITKRLMQEGDPGVGTEDVPRLTLRDRDANFFRAYIQEEDGLQRLADLTVPPDTEAQKNIQQNALFLLQEARKLPEARCARLVQFMMQNCWMVVVSTPDDESAFRIFSVLNDRGLDLTISDILKAEFLRRLPDAKQEQYEEQWEELEVGLGRRNFETLFAHVRTIHVKRKPKDTVLKEFREHVLGGVTNAEAFLRDTLFPYAEAFSTIRQRNYDNIDAKAADEVNRALRWLNGYIDNIDWVPPAVLFLKFHEQDPKKLSAFFRDLERLAAAMLVLRYGVNDRLERYGQILTVIEASADLSVPSSPLQLSAQECRDMLDALNGDIYRAHRLVRRLVLWRLNNELSQHKPAYDPEELSIEHVLPQMPDWTKKGSGDWASWYTLADHSQVVHRLGNLVLLTRRKNAAASNSDFATKVKKYFAPKQGVANFAITETVIVESAWDRTVFEKHQAARLALLKATWRL